MSMISLVGVAVGAMALVIILSVYNGFDGYVRSLYSTFDPDIKVMPAEGKYFTYDEQLERKIRAVEGVEAASRVIEENALAKYNDRQQIVTIKGVDNAYSRVVGIDTMLAAGSFSLVHGDLNQASVGAMIAQSLGVGSW